MGTFNSYRSLSSSWRGPFFHRDDTRNQRKCLRKWQNLITGTIPAIGVCRNTEITGLYRSHATYYYIAAGMQTQNIYISIPSLTFIIGCYIALQNYTKAKELFDTIPNLIDRRKINGKELPTEVLIKKKREARFQFRIFGIYPYIAATSRIL